MLYFFVTTFIILILQLRFNDFSYSLGYLVGEESKRNQRIFEGKEIIFEDLFEKAKYVASTWAPADPSFIQFSVSLIC